MQFESGRNSQSMDNDHYVAFLSSGANPQSLPRSHCEKQLNKKRQRASRLGSRLAKLTAAVIGLLVVTGTLIIFTSIRSEPENPALLHATGAFSSNGRSLFNRLDFVRPFEEFIAKHGKVYATLEEKERRLEIFAKNLLYIDLHNSQNFTYTLAVNAFADLTFDEFKTHRFTGYRERNSNRLKQSQGASTDWALLNVDQPLVPTAMNWRDKGCVGAPKDQRQCGSCWAFSASGAVEGAYCAKHGKLVNLSEQQMVDCAGPEGNDGCNGGEMDDAFQYIMDHGGLCTEESYPYEAQDAQCRDEECTDIVKVESFVDVPHRSEKALRAAVALRSPVSVAIQADQLPFQFYHEGVFDSPCGTKLNHGVLVVGYGTDTESNKDYWVVKNSWGAKWGEEGFMKLVRNDGSRSGKCGVLLDASYPIVE